MIDLKAKIARYYESYFYFASFGSGGMD